MFLENVFMLCRLFLLNFLKRVLVIFVTYIHRCTHTYIHTCIRTYIHIYIYMYVHIHTYIHIYKYTYIYTYVRTYTHMSETIQYFAIKMVKPFLSSVISSGVITPNQIPLTTIVTYLQMFYRSRISNHWATKPACSVVSPIYKQSKKHIVTYHF